MKIFKKLLAAAAAIVMASGVCSGGYQPLIGNLNTVSAANYGDIMEYEDYLSYRKIDEDEDGAYDYIMICKCDKSAVSVKIPPEIDDLPVTHIGYEAFSDCTSLTSIEIPDSITEINSDAFSGMPLLENQTGVKYADKWVIGCDKDVTKAEIKSGTKGIANSAFSDCTSLTSVEIPNSITAIGMWTFKNCTSLTSVVIPDSVTKIEEWAFSGCISLESVVIPDKVTFIGDSAFENCTSLTSVVIPDSVTLIDEDAFKNCTSLTSVVIPDKVTFIGDSAFENCTNLESITIKNPECDIYNIASTISAISNGRDENWKPYFNGTIYGYENSTAQTYAEERGYKFESLGEPPVTLIGDISGNGKIDLSDAIIIAQFILGKITFTDEEKVIADINEDGRINLSDAIEIASYILKDMKK